MISKSEGHDIELICVVVNFGVGSKVIKFAKSCGVSGGTISLGKGTVNSRIMDFIGLSDMRKEVVYLAAERETAEKAIKQLNDEFAFKKPGHGIAFTTSICSIMGTRTIICDNKVDERGANNTMYHLITVIVEKGRGEDVITAATKAGSTGGTIINGRGAGIHETSKLFSMDIEPERELVYILTKKEITTNILTSIRDDLEMDKPGNGIIYTQDVNNVYGIFEK